MRPNPETSRTSPRRTSVRLVLISDTHELHREVEVPDGDILIHAGDFTMFSQSIAEITDFNNWLGELPHRHKIVVPGNHEFFLEADPSERFLLGNTTVLINEAIEIEGLRIWGSPVTPLFGGAFGMSSAKDRKRLYAQIPEDIDVLITHGPPYGILDTAPISGLREGCGELLDAVIRIRPKLHVFGHIHGAYGVFRTEHTQRLSTLHGSAFIAMRTKRHLFSRWPKDERGFFVQEAGSILPHEANPILNPQLTQRR
jgi:Icc-related predicted phosphoesterase